MRLIDADKLVDMLYDNEYTILCPLDEVSGVIDNCPTVANVAPVVHGRWEPCFDENGCWRQGFAKCSNCGKEYYAQTINHFRYCSNCGAKMDGGSDHE